VVESTSDAQRCVELLRRNHLGVATCLILEKQKGLAASMNERVQTPEGKRFIGRRSMRLLQLEAPCLHVT
jgi:chromosome segregation ATPase